MAQWAATVLPVPRMRPRQFEYHPTEEHLLLFGTRDSKVAVTDLSTTENVGLAEVGARRHSDAVLGLGWFRHNPPYFVAGTSGGVIKMFRLEDHDRGLTDLRVRFPPFENLTSVSINATDSLLLVSGYSSHAVLFDTETGREARRFADIHQGHINISRFANTSPFLFATSSFDCTVKTWDIRAPMTRPLYTCSTEEGLVMCSFCPNDNYLLASAVDNEVRQFLAVDGRLHLKLDADRTGLKNNFTRSYYMNSGSTIVTGSSEQRVVRLFCAHTGSCLDTVDIFPGAKHESVHVQSLRGCPLGKNRFAVLAHYRNDMYNSELVHFQCQETSKRTVRLRSLSSLGRFAGDRRSSSQVQSAPIFKAEGGTLASDMSHERAALCKRYLPSAKLADDCLKALYGAEYADVHLVVQGRTFPAHLALLSARPSLLRDVLQRRRESDCSLARQRDPKDSRAKASLATLLKTGPAPQLSPSSRLVSSASPPKLQRHMARSVADAEVVEQPGGDDTDVKVLRVRLPACSCCGREGACSSAQVCAVFPLLLEVLYTDRISAIAFRRVLVAIRSSWMSVREAGGPMQMDDEDAGVKVEDDSDLMMLDHEDMEDSWSASDANVRRIGKVSFGGPNGDLRAAGVIASLATSFAACCGGPGVVVAALECCARTALALGIGQAIPLLECVGRAAISVETVAAILDLTLRMPELTQLREACGDFWVRHHEVLRPIVCRQIEANRDAGDARRDSEAEEMQVGEQDLPSPEAIRDVVFLLSMQGLFSAADEPTSDPPTLSTLSQRGSSSTADTSFAWRKSSFARSSVSEDVMGLGRAPYSLFRYYFAQIAEEIDPSMRRKCMDPSSQDVWDACGAYRSAPYGMRLEALLTSFDEEIGALWAVDEMELGHRTSITGMQLRASSELHASSEGRGRSAVNVSGIPPKQGLPLMAGQYAHLGNADCLYFFLGRNSQGFESTDYVSAMHLPSGRHLRVRARGPGPAQVHGHSGCAISEGGLGDPMPDGVGQDWRNRNLSTRFCLIGGGRRPPGHIDSSRPSQYGPPFGLWLFDTEYSCWYEVGDVAKGRPLGERTGHTMVAFPASRREQGEGEQTRVEFECGHADPSMGMLGSLKFVKNLDGGIRIVDERGATVVPDLSGATNVVVYGGSDGTSPEPSVRILSCYRRDTSPGDLAVAGLPPSNNASPRAEGPPISRAATPREMFDVTETLPGALAEAVPDCPFSFAWVTPQVHGDAPLPRTAHAACAVQHGGHQFMLVFGGMSHTYEALNDVCALHMDSLLSLGWSSPQVFGEALLPRQHHSMTFIESSSTVVVYGGRVPGSNLPLVDPCILRLDSEPESGFCIHVSHPELATGYPRPDTRTFHSAICAPTYPSWMPDVGEEDDFRGHSAAVYVFGGHSTRIMPPSPRDNRVWCLNITDSASTVRWTLRRQGPLESGGEAHVDSPPRTLHEDLAAMLLPSTAAGPGAAARRGDQLSTVRFVFSKSSSSGVEEAKGDERQSDFLLAHRVFVEASSEVLRRMLSSGMKEAILSEVHVADVDKSTFRSLLHFMYTNTLAVAPEKVADLLVCASRYGVTDLVKLLEGAIFEFLSVENVCSIIHLADLHSLENLRSSCFGFTFQYWSEIYNSSAWQQLPRELQGEIIGYRRSGKHVHACSVEDHLERDNFGAFNLGRDGQAEMSQYASSREDAYGARLHLPFPLASRAPNYLDSTGRRQLDEVFFPSRVSSGSDSL